MFRPWPRPRSRVRPRSLPALAFARPRLVPSGRHFALASHTRVCCHGHWHWDGMCGLAVKSSPTASSPHVPPGLAGWRRRVLSWTAVRGIRGPGRRGCAPAAAYLPDPSFPPRSSSPSPAPSAPCAPSCGARPHSRLTGGLHQLLLQRRPPATRSPQWWPLRSPPWNQPPARVWLALTSAPLEMRVDT